jgi:hypothetical protein
MVQVVLHLPRKCKALSSNSSTIPPNSLNWEGVIAYLSYGVSWRIWKFCWEYVVAKLLSLMDPAVLFFRLNFILLQSLSVEILTSKWGTKQMRSLIHENSDSLIKEINESLCALWGHSKKVLSMNQKTDPHRTPPCWHPILTFSLQKW